MPGFSKEDVEDEVLGKCFLIEQNLKLIVRWFEIVFISSGKIILLYESTLILNKGPV